VVGRDRRLVGAGFGARVDLKAVALQRGQELAVAARDRRLRLAPGIGEEAQAAARRDARVELPQRSKFKKPF
jgi:hypothetical protein